MTCEREPEVLECVLEARWPDAATEELRGHVSECASCRDLASAASAVASDHAAAARAARVPSAGLVWWRAERRAQREALQKAARASIAVQAVPILAAIVFTVALATGAGWTLHVDLTGIASHWRLLLLLALPCITIAPAAVYLALQRD